MNAFYKMYCRTFQAVLKQLIKLMPWRKPELLRFDNGAAGLAGFIKGKGLNSVLVVTDGNLMKLGLCAPMLEALEKEGVKAAVYDKVVANPTIVNVEEALKLYNESGAQGIIAFGGGSPMDCAKGVGARVARPNKPIPKMKGILKVVKKMPPFWARAAKQLWRRSSRTPRIPIIISNMQFRISRSFRTMRCSILL